MDSVGIHGAIGVSDQMAEIDPLGFEMDGNVGTLYFGTKERRKAQALQVVSHFAAQHVDGAGAENADGVSFVGGARVDRGRRRVREMGADEDVGDKVAAAADKGFVVAAGARIWRPALQCAGMSYLAAF